MNLISNYWETRLIDLFFKFSGRENENSDENRKIRIMNPKVINYIT